MIRANVSKEEALALFPCKEIEMYYYWLLYRWYPCNDKRRVDSIQEGDLVLVKNTNTGQIRILKYNRG